MLTNLFRDLLQLRRHQWSPRQELEAIQLQKLKAMVRHAYENVPFYRALYTRHGVRPEDIRTLEDLGRFPVVGKEDVRDGFPHGIVAGGVDLAACSVTPTTGSTGIPLQVVEDPAARNYTTALQLYAFLEAGVKCRDRFVDLCVPKNEPEPTILEKWRLVRKHKLLLTEPVEVNLERLRRIRADVLFTYPSVLVLYAKALAETRGDGVRPRLVFPHGEMLAPDSRRLIERAFGAEVRETYGATEFPRLAFECEAHQGMHAISDCAIMEITRGGEVLGSEEPGEIVITGLYNFAMPLIRYKIGDIGILSRRACGCGRTYPVIKEIVGRNNDFLQLPSGRVIPWRPINLVTVPGIREYKIIQEEKDLFRVLMVEGADYSQATVQLIEKKIKDGCLGERVTVLVDRVQSIPKETTGKLRAIVSRVKCNPFAP